MSAAPATTERHAPKLDAENPWPGLAPFAEEQAAFFHGRHREVEDLFRRVKLNRLTVLYGQSGLGKTSVLHAALFPRLRSAGLLPIPIRLDYSSGSLPPRTQIWHAVASALEAIGVSVTVLGEDETLWEYFHLRTLDLRRADGQAVVPVLVFDQFEELFTVGREREEGRSFVRDCVDELAALSENRPSDRVEARFDRKPELVSRYDFDRADYRILLSLREDYLAHLHDLADKIPSVKLNNMRLSPLDGARALEAVEKPGGRLVAPGAAEAIVRVVAGAREPQRGQRETPTNLQPLQAGQRGLTTDPPIESLVVEPSLLSLLCRELNQKRREDGLPAITPDLVSANRENILNSFYARCLADLPSGAQAFVEEDLLTESGFRETIAVENAETKLRQRGADPEALKLLVGRRLLHYEQRGQTTRVELTHDVLAPVVRQSRSLRREREAVQAAEARERRDLEAKYARSRRQRRLITLFGLVMTLGVVIATWMVVTLNHERNEAESLKRVFSRHMVDAGDSLVGYSRKDAAPLNSFVDNADSLVRDVERISRRSLDTRVLQLWLAVINAYRYRDSLKSLKSARAALDSARSIVRDAERQGSDSWDRRMLLWAFYNGGQRLLFLGDLKGVVGGAIDGVRLAEVSDIDDATVYWLVRLHDLQDQALLAQGDTAGANSSRRVMVETAQRFLQLEDAPSTRGSLSFSGLSRLDSILFDADSFAAAAAVSRKIVALQREAHAARESVQPDSMLAQALGHQSWELLFAGHPAEALAAAEEGLRLSPDQTWILTNQAHALFLLGRLAEAKSLYRRIVGQGVSGGTLWDGLVQDMRALLDKGVMSGAQVRTVETWLGSSQDVTLVVGRWTGTYTCAQGMTGLTLLVEPDSVGLTAKFGFYAVASNPSVPSGSFQMWGWYTRDGHMELVGTKWITRPSDWMMISLSGQVDRGGRRFSGVVPQCQNSPFSVGRR